MASAESFQPTLADKIAIVPLVFNILLSVSQSLFTAPFRAPQQTGAPTVTEHVSNAAVRAVTDNVRIGTAQWIAPLFVDTYVKFYRKSGRVPDIADIPVGTKSIKAFWLGDRKAARTVMVYSHGGGFVFTGSEMHLAMLDRWVRWSGGGLAILCVCYTLSPGARYPVAIGEVVEALRWVLEKEGRRPGEVLLGGDSAGGSLALAVLSHVSGHTHPNEQLVKKLDLGEGEELKGVLVVAPWVSHDKVKYKSVQRMRNRDIIGPSCADYWSQAYMGNTKDDEYSWAVLAGSQWWKGVKCERILVTAGEEEILFDGITDFVGKLEEGAGKERVKYVVGVKETHVHSLKLTDDKKVDLQGERSSDGAIKSWIRTYAMVHES